MILWLTTNAWFTVPAFVVIVLLLVWGIGFIVARFLGDKQQDTSYEKVKRWVTSDDLEVTMRKRD